MLKFFAYFFLSLIVYSSSVQAVIGVNEGQESVFGSFAKKCLLFRDYIAHVVTYPLRVMGRVFFQGVIENPFYKPAVENHGNDQDPEHPKSPLDKQIDAITASFFKALAEVTDPKKKQAEGARFIKNMLAVGAITIADLYNPEGEGRIALENIMKSIRAFIKEHGVIRETIKDVRLLITKEIIELLKEFDQMNRENGVARDTVHSIAENISRGVDRVGNSVDVSSRKVVRNVLIGSIITIGSWYAYKHIERILVKPRLVLETSYRNPWQKVVAFFNPPAKKEKLTMIASPELQQRLFMVATTTKNIKDKIKNGQTHVTFRNLLLWGPPGTGKTMFGRILAQESEMDYAIISGASFTQFQKGEGITEMNNLFDWVNSSSDGVVLFIDEADAFLGGRAGKEVTKEAYQLLTNFLNLTGQRSSKVMLIFATNHAEVLDPAIKRRIDDSIEMKLPEIQERYEILKLYRDKKMSIVDSTTSDFKDSVTRLLHDEALHSMAMRLDGLSGGELEGVINSAIAEASMSLDGSISQEMIDRVILHAREKEHSFTHGFRHPWIH